MRNTFNMFFVIFQLNLYTLQVILYPPTTHVLINPPTWLSWYQ